MRRYTWTQVAVLALLGSIAVFAAWDYVEVVRLDRELARIRSRGEPAVLADIPAVSREQESRASQYYRAAAALVTDSVPHGYPNTTLFSAQLESARRSNSWNDTLIAEMRRQVTANSDALELVDRAAALEFTGFPDSSVYVSREMDMFDLVRITRLRTMLWALDGRGDDAARSLYAGLRVLHAMGFWGTASNQQSRWIGFAMIAPVLEMVVTRSPPSSATLTPVASGLAALDDDDLPRNNLLWRRASSQLNIDSPYWRGRWEGAIARVFKFGESLSAAIQMPFYRPFVLNGMNRRLRDYGKAIDSQTGKGWPERLDAIAALKGAVPEAMLGHVDAVAVELARIRAARTVVAIERVRRTGATAVIDWAALAPFQTPLIDPYSGQPLRIGANDQGYVVYSIGRNRRDDGGDPTHDISLRVTINH